MKMSLSQEYSARDLRRVEKILPDLNPLDKAEINYLCIEKCSVKTYKAEHN